MPSNPPIPAPANLPHGILLVEEYGALAVAISSALRKFASLHRVEVAHDFAEAEAAAARMRPELFVLDLDPPPSGDIAFLERLQALYPEARALVLAADTSRALRAERGTSGAIQFIEKPFDLADFGAAVQALVGPWAGPAGSVRGTLRDLSLLDIALAKCFSDSSARLRIEMAAGSNGELHFQKGQITHAATGGLTGFPALEEILSWPDGTWSEDELPADALRTIDIPRDELLLPAVRRQAEKRKGDSLADPPPPPPIGRKILVIDDTEMLLIFVADVLATAGQNFEVVTAARGDDGVRLAAETQPDLVLLDYSLTDMTGDKVCRALLENERTARIPVLMMSGHLSELARTAEDYANVVAALPKPFLSGALINAVEKALDEGPLPSPVTPVPEVPAPAPVAPAPPTEETTSSSPNGHGPGGDGSTTKPADVATTVVTEPPPPALPTPLPLALPPRPPEESGADAPPRAAPVVRQTGLKVTFSLDVLALGLTPLLQMKAVRLQPVNRIVAVEMEQAEGASEGAIETGFRLGQVQLATDGQIDTLRLIPTRQGFRIPEAANAFAIGDFTLRRKNSHREIELVATPDKAMTVQLIAPFELLQVELSPAFEIRTLIVRARGARVVIRNSRMGEGTAFELEEVELDPAGELQQLLVRPMA